MICAQTDFYPELAYRIQCVYDRNTRANTRELPIKRMMNTLMDETKKPKVATRMGCHLKFV